MRNLGTKLFVLISLFIGCFFSFLFYRSYQISNKYTVYLLQQQADMALKFEMATRKYIGEQVRPVMYELVGEDRFIPETMSSSFVARAIFTEVKKDFPDFILKFSSDNPRNPLNEAGPEEQEIIDFFNQNRLCLTNK